MDKRWYNIKQETSSQDKQQPEMEKVTSFQMVSYLLLVLKSTVTLLCFEILLPLWKCVLIGMLDLELGQMRIY